MRRARDSWISLVEQFGRSGLTQEAFATERHIPVGTLRSWIYRLRREQNDAVATESTPILPVRVVASAAPVARQPEAAVAPAIEVKVGATLRIRFPPGTPSSVIADVVALLHERC